jgi:hypothetical protein
MRFWVLVLGFLVLAGCSDSPQGAGSRPGGERPAGMPEDIWKVYSGAESGVAEGEKTGAAPEHPPKK